MPKQLDIWKGDFGEQWAIRNGNTQENISKRIHMFQRIFSNVPEAPSFNKILEIGAGLGVNLQALQTLSNANLYACEPNEYCYTKLLELPFLSQNNVSQDSIFQLPQEKNSMDLVFTSGVLIHVHPEQLFDACTEIYRVSNKYILSIEYFSHTPETITYRGNDNFLFKRDFGDYFLQHFPDLIIKDYGFLWQPATGLGNMTWFLLEKKSHA